MYKQTHISQEVAESVCNLPFLQLAATHSCSHGLEGWLPLHSPYLPLTLALPLCNPIASCNSSTAAGTLLGICCLACRPLL